MPEKNQSFLEILNEYFAQNRHESQQESDAEGKKQKVTIPMEYIFTKRLDRAIIERGFVNLICAANKEYRRKMQQDREFYGKISSLDIETDEKGTNLVINARDGWTKVVVTEDKNLRGPFYAVSEDRLYEEILRAYNIKSVGYICQKYNLSKEEREQLIAQLQEPQKRSKRKESIISAMGNAGENFVEYYKYMTGDHENKKDEALEGVIQQRKGQGPKRKNKGSGTTSRKSEIYDFQQRAEILEEMKPAYKINIDKIEDDNTVSKFAYTTYVYKNPRDRQGYLFVAEPLEGTHSTRMRFVPKEEYDRLPATQNKNKLVGITEEFLEMSDSEFTGSKFSKKFNHTDIEGLRAKFRRVILGEKMPTSLEEMRYRETDRILFDGETRLTKENIREVLAGRTASEISVARQELYGRPKESTIQIPQ